MTVRELIEILQQQNPDATVVVADTGNDLTEPAEVLPGFYNPKATWLNVSRLPTDSRKTPAVLID